jgi:Sporulation and spore germination
VRSSRLPVLIVLLAVVAAGVWYLLSHRAAGPAGNLTVYYTKLDGTTLGNLSVSLRPRASGESGAEHLHNVALYAAVEAVAGPPSQVHAIRFPAGTRVLDASVNGSTATVDLSKEVEQQPGGSFAENGEFKALVYTMTAVPGIDAVQVKIEGETLPTLPGGHIELDTPLRRSDW